IRAPSPGVADPAGARPGLTLRFHGRAPIPLLPPALACFLPVGGRPAGGLAHEREGMRVRGAFCVVLPLLALRRPAAASLESVVAEADDVLVGLVVDRRGPDIAVVALEYLKSATFQPRLVLTLPPGEGPLPGHHVLLALHARDGGRPEVVGGAAHIYRLRERTATALASGVTLPRAELLARIRGVVKVPPPAYGGAMLLEQPG